MAARKLGCGLRENGDRFEFYDPVGGLIIAGVGDKDGKIALNSACNRFVAHLSGK